MGERICSIDGCERPVLVKLRGWCRRHYRRWRIHGDPLAGGKAPGVGDGIGYTAAHDRLKRLLGSAKTFSCSHCGEVAQDWAYDHADSNERWGENHERPSVYSLDPAHYFPLCRSCHKRFDLKTHCIHGHEYTSENTFVDTRGRRHCRECQRRGQRNRRRAAPADQA